MIVIFKTILYLTGIIIYAKRIQWIIFFWMSLYVFAPPIYTIILGSHHDILLQVDNDILDISRNLIILITFFEIVKRWKLPNLRIIYLSFFLLSIYLLIFSFRDIFTIHKLWTYYSEVLSLIIIIPFLEIRKDAIPSQQNIIKYITVVLIFQFVICIANYNNLYLYIPHYYDIIYTAANGSTIELMESKICGTFIRYNSLANYLTTIYLFISLEYFTTKIISKNHFLVLSLILFIIIASTGAKVSMLLFIFILFSASCLNFKENKKYIIIVFWGVVIGYIYLMNYNTSNKNENLNLGINRQLSGLASFLQSDKEDDNSTISLSRYLFREYFNKKPFLGNALSYKGEDAYGSGYTGQHTLVHFRADARVVYQLVEFGIVGFLFYLFFFISLFIYFSYNQNHINRKKIIICFFYYLLLTITEAGFFEKYCFPVLFIYFFCFIRNRYPISNILPDSYDKH